VGEVPDGQRDVPEAAVAQLVHDHVKDGALAHGEERLGQNRRVGPQSGSLAAGEDHGSSSHCCFCRQGSQKVESAAYACSPMQIVWKVMYWLAVLAISVVLLVVLMRWFESRDASKVEGSSVVQPVV
jgi:hypothetical protein